MKKKVIPFYLSLTLTLFIWQCSPKINQPVVISPPSISLAQFTFDATPNDLDNVGYVFALDSSNISYGIANLDLKPTNGDAQLPSNTTTRNLSYGAILNFLGVKNLNLGVKDSLSHKRQITTTVSFDQPIYTRGVITNLDVALQNNQAEISKALNDLKLGNAKLYVILETIKTKKLTYDFKASKITTDTLNANFEQIATLKGGVSWGNSGSPSLSYTSATPLTVFYKLLKVSVLGSTTGVYTFRAGSTPVSMNELIKTKH